MRSGFTIVEVLVALMVVALAVIGLAGTAGLVAALSGEGVQLTRVAHRARSIMDSLATMRCVQLVDGRDAAPPLPAEWVVSTSVNMASVSVTVRGHTRRGERSHSFRSAVPCAAD